MVLKYPYSIDSQSHLPLKFEILYCPSVLFSVSNYIHMVIQSDIDEFAY